MSEKYGVCIRILSTKKKDIKTLLYKLFNIKEDSVIKKNGEFFIFELFSKEKDIEIPLHLITSNITLIKTVFNEKGSYTYVFNSNNYKKYYGLDVDEALIQKESYPTFAEIIDYILLDSNMEYKNILKFKEIKGSNLYNSVVDKIILYSDSKWTKSYLINVLNKIINNLDKYKDIKINTLYDVFLLKKEADNLLI